MNRYVVFFVMLIIGINGCGPKEKHDESEDAFFANSGCVFNYKADATKLTWTAYKYSEKIGVKGTFDSILVSGLKPSGSAAGLLANMEFVIDSKSVNSGSPIRDPKLVSFFFGKLQSEKISGKIISLEDDGSRQALIEITMNGISQKVPVSFEFVDGKMPSLKMATDINLEQWQAGEAMESLNTACEELHKGEDGVSKLWPDVKIEISARLDKLCNE